MSLSHSPAVVTNGLVFYYDMANSQKSWKGKPVTNLVNPVWSNWGIDGSGQGSIGTRTITSPYECTIVDNNANTRQSISISSGITAGTTYTFSVQYKKNYGAPTLRFQIQAYNSSTYLSTMSFATTAQLGILDINDWQTAKITVTTPANTNRIVWFMQDGDDYTTYTHSFSLKNVQYEQNSFATPFVDGTRSNTQAVVDLTGNNTVTANSLTYASDGTFSFDGSSNDVTISGPASNFFNNFSSQQITLDTWVNIPSSATWTNGFFGNILSRGNYAGSCGLWRTTTNNQVAAYFRQSGSTFAAIQSSATIQRDVWVNIVATWSGSTLILYINGTQASSNSGVLGTPTVANWTIGNVTAAGGNSGNRFQGSLSVSKIYDRALSAGEVAQNFNALRGRYGI